MECKDTEQFITMCVDGVLDPKMEDQLTRHMEICLHCRKTFEQERQIKSLLADKTRRVQAPAHLVSLVQASLRTAPEPISWWQRAGELVEWYPRYVASALAAMLVIAVISVLLISRQQQPPLLVVELVKHHANCAIEISSSQSNDMQDWFKDRGFDGVSNVPSLEEFDYKLLGAHLCQMLHKDAAYLVYERDGTEISICCVKDVPIELEALNRVEFENAQFYTITYGDRNLVLWQEGDTIYSIVGPEEQGELVAMAAETRSL